MNGFQNAENNVSIPANDFIVFVGARDLPSGLLGLGGPGGYSWQSNRVGNFTGSELAYIDQTNTQFESAVETRGETTGFARWGGSISVDSNANWHFNQTTTPAGSEFDFYSVVLHELAHTLGFGASQEWQDLVSGTTFVGAQAKAQYAQSGGVPLAPPEGTDPAGHWKSTISKSTVYGGSTAQTPLMVPALLSGEPRRLTNLDAAALVDLGWEIALPQPVPGDYNRNGIVDAADYTVWRDTLGSTTDLRANGSNSGASANKIDQADYAFWKSHFGQHAGSGAGAIRVPEPASPVILLIVAGSSLTTRRRRRRVGLRL